MTGGSDLGRLLTVGGARRHAASEDLLVPGSPYPAIGDLLSGPSRTGQLACWPCVSGCWDRLK
jgi:hypothetical protein